MLSQDHSASAGAPSRAFNIAYTILWRDWKGGQLNLLILSLVLAVATVCSISLFTSRIHNAIFDEASHFIAADAKISGIMPVNDAWREKVQSLDLQTANIIRFSAMAFAGETMRLGQIKAVSEGYPLKGQVAIAAQPFAESFYSKTVPASGEAWLAPRLFEALQVQVGDTIVIGEAQFEVTAAIAKEPDSGQSFFGVAPRIMINIADVDATEAVQLGSRIDYSWLLAGDASELASFKRWVTPQLGSHYEWVDVQSENRGVGNALKKAEKFLLLTGCLSVLLTGVAIALAARRYAKRQHTAVALLKTFGVTPKKITRIYLTNLFAVGIVSLVVGSIGGWLLHWGIVLGLGDLVPKDLAAASWDAYFTGGLTGFVGLFAFAAPPILSLRNVAPASILRATENVGFSTLWGTVVGVVALVFLMLLYSRDIFLTLLVSLSATVCFAFVGISSSGLIWLTKKLGKQLSYSWRLGFANLQRHKKFNALQIVVFSILFMMLFILFSVRTNLLSQWQKQIPEDTPNHFAFNIFAEQKTGIEQFFVENQINNTPFYPMTRGRFIYLNDEEVKELAKTAKKGMNYRRELNLTQSETLGQDNKIVDGVWWGAHPKADSLLVSVEQEYAEGLGINVGDILTFSIAGQEVVAEVANIRSVQWDSMNPNFFMIFNRDFLSSSATNWVTSFYLSAENKLLLNALARQFPSISLIEFDQSIKQIQSIIEKVSMAIEFILLLVIAAGVLVLITSIQATLDNRIQEGAIFRTLGAGKRMVRQILLIEFACLGFLAGLLAVVGSELSLYFLQTRVFDLNYVAQLPVVVFGPMMTSLLIAVIGWLSTRRVVNTPPLIVLRDNN